MPHPDWEDISAFFDLDEFATTAVITRDAEKVADVLGIFDDPSQMATLGEFEFDSPGPRFVCREDAVSAVKRGDTATIEGKVFDVLEEPQLDGTGIATLTLAVPNVIYNAGL
jgi:hypothetical protein